MTAIALTDAHRQLADALMDDPRPLPCLSGEPLSDDRAARAHVAEQLCPSCPVLALCFEAGETEQWGIWGAVDRSPAPAPRRPTARKAARA